MRYSKYKYGRKRVPAVFYVTSALLILSVILLIFSKISTAAADFLNDNLCYYVRMLLAIPSSLVPFSLFELLIILLPIIITLVVILAVRRFHSREGRGRFLLGLSSLVFAIATLYILTLSIAYNTTTLDRRLGLKDVEANAESLSSAMIKLRDEVNALSADITYGEDGASVPEYGFREMSEKICSSFGTVNEKYSLKGSFNSSAKQIYFGNVMSYFRLTGIYTFYTGEANVNSAYPYYDKAFTAAHELSHQRGILRENEANFMAYLVNSHSEDKYLRYSAALSMYEYIASALYRTDRERYYEIAGGLSERARGDILASNAVTEKYGDTFLADLSSFFNDLFLKTNGTDGVVTYGRVVTLAVSYLNQ